MKFTQKVVLKVEIPERDMKHYLIILILANLSCIHLKKYENLVVIYLHTKWEINFKYF